MLLQRKSLAFVAPSCEKHLIFMLLKVRKYFYFITARCTRISAYNAVTRCPSVCASVTFVSCAKMNKDIIEIFSLSGSQAILVFPYKTWWRYSDGNPLMGASNARGYEKIDDFRPISRCISETVIVRWAHAARQFISIKFTFHPYNI